MGRPKGAKAKGPRVELEVTGLEALPVEIPKWELRLIDGRLGAIAGEQDRGGAAEGGSDAAG